ncbi:MAG: hypothetical protein R2828_16740 [Saprospiraceae bacterium]
MLLLPHPRRRAEGYRAMRFIPFNNNIGEDQMTKVNVEKLKAELRQFSGTEQYYFNPLFPSFHYTDGVKYLAEQAGAYWLLYYIFSNQTKANLLEQAFQVWKLKVDEDASFKVTVEDGNDQVIDPFKIGFTDFPLDQFELWLIDKVLILPSEY